MQASFLPGTLTDVRGSNVHHTHRHTRVHGGTYTHTHNFGETLQRSHNVQNISIEILRSSPIMLSSYPADIPGELRKCWEVMRGAVPGERGRERGGCSWENWKDSISLGQHTMTVWSSRLNWFLFGWWRGESKPSPRVWKGREGVGIRRCDVCLCVCEAEMVQQSWGSVNEQAIVFFIECSSIYECNKGTYTWVLTRQTHASLLWLHSVTSGLMCLYVKFSL